MNWANRYVCISKIGEGTYGKVYKVHDKNLPVENESRIKVLKEIAVEKKDRDEIDECTREGKLLSSISFVYIVQFFDLFCDNRFYCIITEFCEGGDLNEFILNTKKKGSLIKECRILKWFLQIMQGLDYIHQRKMLHRDIKTKNVFLKNDSIKIGDFGTARILNCTIEMASTFLGTPYYMSPEVLLHDNYNAKSDIWSAGVILYEMCSLKHAFEAKGIMNIMKLVVEGPCPIIPEYYSKELQNVLERILVKDHDLRPTASDVLQLKFLSKAVDYNGTSLLDSTLSESQFTYTEGGTSSMAEETRNSGLEKQKIKAIKKDGKGRNDGIKDSLDVHKSRFQRKKETSMDSLPFSQMRLQSIGDNSWEGTVTERTMKPSSKGSNTLSKTFPSNQERAKEVTKADQIKNDHLNRTFTIGPDSKYFMYDLSDTDRTVTRRPEEKIKGKDARDIEIDYLEKSCLQFMDEDALTMALTFLDQPVDNTITLSDICQSDEVAHLVDQLHFLKKFR